MGSVFDRKVVLSWQIWLLVKSPYKLIKLGIFQISITSSKISFGTQFKAHIGANHAARHLRLKKLGNKQKKEKVVQGALTSTVFRVQNVALTVTVLATRTVNPGTGKFSLPVPVKSTGVQLILVLPQDEKS